MNVVLEGTGMNGTKGEFMENGNGHKDPLKDPLSTETNGESENILSYNITPWWQNVALDCCNIKTLPSFLGIEIHIP